MSTITVRDQGNFGFDLSPVVGTSLSAAAVASLQDEIEQARELANVLREALVEVRQMGLAAFRPSDIDGPLLGFGLPVGLDLETFFTERLGQPYAGSALTLAQWAEALDRLERWTGAAASRLPPGQGGGSQYVNGTWYVNGDPFSLAELFTLNRVNTFAELDRMVAESLNIINAKNNIAKGLTGLMKNLFDKYQNNTWVVGTDPGTPSKVTLTWVNNVGQYDQTGASPDPFTTAAAVGVSSGTKVPYPVSFADLLAYADKYLGTSSQIRRMNDNVSGLAKEDFRALIDEVEALISTFAEDNQIAQTQNQAILGNRSNLLEGLSAFLKGQQTTRSSVARNL
jgi:hypothetical protein